MTKSNDTIEFYNYISIKTILNIIKKYKTENKSKKLKEVFICMNGNKFEETVLKLPWSLETGDYYIQKYNIKMIRVEGITVYFIITPTVPYNLIRAFPIYI